MSADATYLYRGREGWLPGQDADRPEPPSLSAADIAALAGVSKSSVWKWADRPGFPSPLHRPWARERKWPEGKVRAWLASRNLLGPSR